MQFLLCCFNNEVLVDSPLHVNVRHPTSNYVLAGHCWACRASEPSRCVRALPSPSQGGGVSDPSAAYQKVKKLQKRLQKKIVSYVKNCMCLQTAAKKKKKAFAVSTTLLCIGLKWWKCEVISKSHFKRKKSFPSFLVAYVKGAAIRHNGFSRKASHLLNNKM